MNRAPHSRTSAEDLHERISVERSDGDKDELLIDEASLESFPASDAPSWTPTHAGAPRVEAPPAVRAPELAASLRADMSALEASASGGPDLLARGFLEADRSVTRIPLERGDAENVEAIIAGVAPGADIVVVAPHRDARAGALLLGLARVLDGRRFVRTVRLVGLASGGGRVYARRLRQHGVRSEGMIALDGAELGRLYVVGNLRSRKLASEVCAALGRCPGIGVRAISVPGFVPIASLADSRAFWRERRPAVTMTGFGRLDAEGLADLVVCLSAVVAQLAGGDGLH